jgi:hypothetical protein
LETQGAPDGTKLTADTAAPEERKPVQSGTGAARAASLQDALLRRFMFPFSRPTSLEQVCAYLKRTLKAPVILDLAALERQDVKPEDTVQLEIDGVRLKTGLKLLLDQVGLTYRVVPEDNLLVITDREGSEDPADRIWAELRALHRDLHDVQDAIDELRDYLGDEGSGAAKVRKPTIIEETPEHAGEKPGTAPRKPADPGTKRGGAAPPATGSRPAPPRIPLAGPGRTL